jgi:putative acetyltransferase
VSGATVTLRPYAAADEDAAIALWLRAWQRAMPDIDFAARLAWWRERWRDELVPQAQIVIAEADGVLQGFVTIDPNTGYLDQLVVAPERWGGGTAARLLAEAKRLAPRTIELLVNKENVRAIGFYTKHGFVRTGDDVNPVSGRPVYRMRWQQVAAGE